LCIIQNNSSLIIWINPHIIDEIIETMLNMIHKPWKHKMFFVAN